MKPLLLFWGSGDGGDATATIALSAALKERGLPFALAAYAYGASEVFRERANAAGLEFGNEFFLVSAPERVWTETGLLPCEFDLVHVHHGRTVPKRTDIVPLRHIAQDKPLILTAHGPLPLKSITYGGAKSKISRFFSPIWFDAVVVPSEAKAREWRRMTPLSRNVRAIPNIVRFLPKIPKMAARKELSISANAKVALFCGRLDPDKDPQTFIRAINIAAQTTPRLQGFMLGNGETATECERLIRELGAPVSMAGYVHDPAPYYSAADAFVQPSLYESFGITLLHAMENGLPCAATDIEVFRDFYGGRQGVKWFSPGQADECAKALLCSLSCKPDAKQRIRIREVFAPDPVVESHVDLWESVLAKTPLNAKNRSLPAKETQRTKSKAAALRVLIMNDLLPPDSEGGLELSALEIGRALQDRGHQVEWVCGKWRESYADSRQEDPAIHRILRLADGGENPKSKLPKKLESARAVERKINIAAPNYRVLTRFLSNKQFDVVLVFGVLRTGIGAVRAFADAGIPVVWSIGDVALAVHFDLPRETRLYQAIFGTLGRKWHSVEKEVDFSHMLFTSEFVRAELYSAGIQPRHWAIVPRAVDFSPSYNPFSKTDPPSVVVASRLAPSRGIHVALKALVHLRQRRPDLEWNLEIAGSGDPDYTESLRAIAAPISKQVRFLGRLSKEEVIERMRRASVAINPTVEVEGFGRANIEALACGVALLASDVPSVHEIVDSFDCALLYPPEDSAALSGLLEKVLDDPSLRRDLAHRGVERAKDFLLPRIAEAIESHLQQATGRLRLPAAS